VLWSQSLQKEAYRLTYNNKHLHYSEGGGHLISQKPEAAVDDSGRGDPFGVERVTVPPLPLRHNGVKVPEHADVYVGV
jgi:hypothetical protein